MEISHNGNTTIPIPNQNGAEMLFYEGLNQMECWWSDGIDKLFLSQEGEAAIPPFLVETITWSCSAWCNVCRFSFTTTDEQSSKWNPVTHHLWWFTQQGAIVAPHWPAVEFKKQAANQNRKVDANMSSGVTPEILQDEITLWNIITAWEKK